MTRKVTINGVRLEVSKTESKKAVDLSCMRFTNNAHQMQATFDNWLNAAPAMEARQRRIAVGKALRLRVPE